MPTKKKTKVIRNKVTRTKLKPSSELAKILSSVSIPELFIDELNRNNPDLNWNKEAELAIDPIKTAEYIQERLAIILEAVRTNSKID